MKRISYRKVLLVLGWILTVSGLAVSMGFVSRRTGDIIAGELDINILNSEENYFISEKEVRSFFTSGESPVLASRYRNIRLNEIEKTLRAHPSVESAEVSADLDGTLKVDLVQRTPLLRIINKTGESYYIDTRARLMPLCDNFTARVLIASGEIIEPYAGRYQYSIDQIKESKSFSEISLLDDLYEIAAHIASDSILSSMVHQIYVNAEKDIELVPSLGPKRVLFGDASNVTEKFNKLKLFYTQGLNKADAWTKYSSINLKYRNLVVCARK